MRFIIEISFIFETRGIEGQSNGTANTVADDMGAHSISGSESNLTQNQIFDKLSSNY
jgi:hypothetical protein